MTGPSEDRRTLRDYLNVPYVVESTSIEIAPGVWTRRVRYPELPDCAAEDEIIETAIRMLERQRIQTIIRMLRNGKLPPHPRSRLANSDPAWTAKEAGLDHAVLDLFDKTVAELRGIPDPFA
jgi:hypothetical protein